MKVSQKGKVKSNHAEAVLEDEKLMKALGEHHK